MRVPINRLFSKKLASRVFNWLCGTFRQPTILHPQWLFIHQYQQLLEAQKEFVSGDVLDIGSGDRYFERFFQGHYTRYIALDYPKTGEMLSDAHEPDIAGDGRHLPFQSKAFDTVFLLEVLEHCPEPAQILYEASRVLENRGTILITAPLTIPEHLRPHDYYRYTQDGLRYLLRGTRLSIKRLIPIGSSGSVLAYYANYSLFEGTFTNQSLLVRGLKFLFTPFILCIWLMMNLVGLMLDRFFFKEGFVMGYCLVTQKE